MAIIKEYYKDSVYNLAITANKMAHILLVEDDVSLANLTRLHLQTEGYKVDLANNGDKALAQCGVITYDLILLDVVLPQTDGFTVCKRLRKQGVETPIIFLTAKKDTMDIVSGLDLSADGYITKPYKLAELSARIRALLRRPPQPTKNRIQVGALQVDLLKQEVWRGTERIDLRRRELQILSILLEQPGQIISRMDLIDQLPHNHRLDNKSGTIDVHINRLRHKLGTQVIETIHGMGYRINALQLANGS